MIATVRLALSRLETLPVPKPSELKELKAARGAKAPADFPSGGGCWGLPQVPGAWLVLVLFYLAGNWGGSNLI